jgi:hypothetical protein
MKTTMLTAGAALCLAAALPLQAADWVDVKDPKALRALYSNKTFKGKDYLDRPWVGHYRADGQGLLVTHDGSRIPRKWAVQGKDQVCVESQFPRVCVRIQRHTSQAGVYRSINVANDMATVFVVEDGVPQF